MMTNLARRAVKMFPRKHIPDKQMRRRLQHKWILAMRYLYKCGLVKPHVEKR